MPKIYGYCRVSTAEQNEDRLTMTAPVGSWLERLLGEIRKAEKSTENRVYIPRVRR